MREHAAAGNADGNGEVSDDLAANFRSARRRQMTVYQTRSGRPRWMLHMQAVFWRVLMGLGMFFHRLAPPRPPKPDFSRQIPSTVSATPGNILLHFYVPRDYETQRMLWNGRKEADGDTGADGDGKNKRRGVVENVSQTLRRRSNTIRRWGGYPVVVNFHGGGFTLGSALDDARWCSTVVDECSAVVCSVDYRLAPECFFPTAVEDGVDAVAWLHKHADELGIDREKIVLSGFSSGGNMAFTVPLRLYDEVAGFPRDDASLHGNDTTASSAPVVHDSASSSSTKVDPNGHNHVEVLDPRDPPPPAPASFGAPTKTSTMATVAEHRTAIPDVRILAIVSWYPSLDYTRTREQRRATCVRKDQELPALFTDLFDESYLHPPDTISLDSPYLSPGVAPTSLLRAALPSEIILHTCEWDMLLDEGKAFHERLISPAIGKRVWYSMVEGVPHGWDKAPNPWKPTPGVREHYLRACKEMRRLFAASGNNDTADYRPQFERMTSAGPSMAPRGSIQVVR